MKIECSIDLSKKKEDSKKSSEKITTISNEIVALDSNDMNVRFFTIPTKVSRKNFFFNFVTNYLKGKKIFNN